MQVTAQILQWGGFLFLGIFLWFFMIRPWRRNGRITTDGLFCLAFLSAYWQDPILNYFQNWATYNTTFINFGSWTHQIPGWNAPLSNRFAEPVVWILRAYIYVMFGGAVMCSFIMRAAKRRWPQLGTMGLMATGFTYMLVFDIILEPIMMLTGLFSYPGAIPRWTLFYGHHYQYPIYEGIFWGGTWAAWGCLRYFQNDKGQTLCERGVEKLNLRSGKRDGVRLLAMVGVVNLMMLVIYNLPMSIIHVGAGSWIDDVKSRSYLSNELCGPRTAYACSGPDVPIPRRNSSHLNPQGELVTPGPRG
jgi:hypothetical protein